MTPDRLAEIRAYIRRLDLDQLPPWTVEQAIIRDLFEAFEEAEVKGEMWEAFQGKLANAWDQGYNAGAGWRQRMSDPLRTSNPYRADAS